MTGDAQRRDELTFLVRGAIARELGDLMDSDAETLVQNTCALTDAVMVALYGPAEQGGVL